LAIFKDGSVLAHLAAVLDADYDEATSSDRAAFRAENLKNP
jgi:hypothetical protein